MELLIGIVVAILLWLIYPEPSRRWLRQSMSRLSRRHPAVAVELESAGSAGCGLLWKAAASSSRRRAWPTRTKSGTEAKTPTRTSARPRHWGGRSSAPVSGKDEQQVGVWFAAMLGGDTDAGQRGSFAREDVQGRH